MLNFAVLHSAILIESVLETKAFMVKKPSGYANQTCFAILNITKSYPSLHLNGRLALLVPNEDFLHKFKGTLLQELKNNFLDWPFVMKSSEESLQLLPQHLCPETAMEPDKEILVVDEADKVAGLEFLFVISIGLDAKIQNTAKDAVTLVSIIEIKL